MRIEIQRNQFAEISNFDYIYDRHASKKGVILSFPHPIDSLVRDLDLRINSAISAHGLPVHTVHVPGVIDVSFSPSIVAEIRPMQQINITILEKHRDNPALTTIIIGII